jgi:hypothetical protein
MDDLDTILGRPLSDSATSIAMRETYAPGWASLDLFDKRKAVGLACQAAGVDLGRAHREYQEKTRRDPGDILGLLVAVVTTPPLAEIDERLRALAERRRVLSQPAPKAPPGASTA